MTTSAKAITQLRALARTLEIANAEGIAERDPETAALIEWFVAAAARYEMDAPNGATLDDCLGLAPSAPGEAPWWRTQAHERRNEAIRQLHREFFADLEVPRAAREISAIAASFTAGKRDALHRIEAGAARLLEDALCTGLRFPGAKQVQNILQGNQIGN